MNGLPTEFGRPVYAEVDEHASQAPLRQAAAWLARLERWFGRCRTVAVARNRVASTEVTVVSAGNDGDGAITIHLASGRPPSIQDRVKIEGSKATLEISRTDIRYTTTGANLDPVGLVLPDADQARAEQLEQVLARSLASREVETVDG